MLAFAECGLKQYIVVLGFKQEIVRSHFEGIAKRRDLSVKFVVAKDWQDGNGSSTLATLAQIKEEHFLLTMVDHVYAAGFVRTFLAGVNGNNGILVGIDSQKEVLFDISDITKVRLSGDTIVEIGKNIPRWDGADTGIFYCNTDIFEALQKAHINGFHSLSDGIRELVKEKKVKAVHVTGQSWLDVDTPEALTEGKRRMIDNLGKNSEDGFISKWLNRKISKRISKLLVKTSITPNQITIISFLLSLVGAFLIAMGYRIESICGALIIQFASILDGCDGEVARLKKIQTRGGAWLDTILDRYADVILALAVTYVTATPQNSSIHWMVGFLCMSGLVLCSYVKKEYQIRFGSPFPNSLLSQLSRRDLRIFVIALATILGFPFYGLIAVGLLSHLFVFFMLPHGFKDTLNYKK